MTADLVAFLRERLNEDEQTAQHAFGAHNGGGPEWVEVSSGALSAGGELHGIGDAALTRHMARHDPARVLAEVAAKRTLVNLHSPRQTPGPTMPIGGKWVETTNLDCITCGGEDRLSPSWPCHTIRYLALPHAEHPGYRKEWRP